MITLAGPASSAMPIRRVVELDGVRRGRRPVIGGSLDRALDMPDRFADRHRPPAR